MTTQLQLINNNNNSIIIIITKPAPRSLNSPISNMSTLPQPIRACTGIAFHVHWDCHCLYDGTRVRFHLPLCAVNQWY